jgi:hypothetical protein
MRALSILYVWMLAPALFFPVVFYTALKQCVEKGRTTVVKRHRPPVRGRDPVYLYYAKRKLHHGHYA